MEDFERCMSLSLYYLGRRARTEKELADYLTRKGMPVAAIAQVMQRLIGYGYIDDAAFAERFAKERIRRGGARKVAFELRAKGVGEAVASEAVAAVDPGEELAGAVRWAEKSMGAARDLGARRRAYASLARRGYAGEVIRKALDIAAGSDSDLQTYEEETL